MLSVVPLDLIEWEMVKGDMSVVGMVIQEFSMLYRESDSDYRLLLKRLNKEMKNLYLTGFWGNWMSPAHSCGSPMRIWKLKQRNCLG